MKNLKKERRDPKTCAKNVGFGPFGSGHPARHEYNAGPPVIEVPCQLTSCRSEVLEILSDYWTLISPAAFPGGVPIEKADCSSFFYDFLAAGDAALAANWIAAW